MYLLNICNLCNGNLNATFGATFAAVIAAFLTYCLGLIRDAQKSKKDTEKRNNKYQSLLYTLSVELGWHSHDFNLLEKTLNEINRASKTYREFVAKNPIKEFNLLICEEIVSHITDYEKFNREILGVLTSYMNIIRNLNHSLDFKDVDETLTRFATENQKEKMINDYITAIEEQYIDKARLAISEILNSIKNELKNYPKDKLGDKEKK